MITIHSSRIEKIVSDFFEDKIKGFEDALETDLTLFMNDPLVTLDWQRLYISKIIEKKHALIKSKFSNLEILRSEFDAIIDKETMSSKAMKSYRDKLLSAIGYTNRRADFYPVYFQKLGIKTCIYCNSQLTISVNAEKQVEDETHEVVKAKFQVDHYIPKSDYPCFSIALYNLYPTCATCNNIKRDKHIEFKLYNEDELSPNISKYNFKLKEGSEANYLLNLNIDEIEIIFEDPDKPNEDEYAEGSFQDTFDISGIYETQKDIAEELIIKAKIYNDTYKDNLIKTFPKLFNEPSLSSRVLIGNYTETEDIHRRPMAKFTQDIARQLKLIK